MQLVNYVHRVRTLVQFLFVLSSALSFLCPYGGSELDTRDLVGVIQIRIRF